MLQTTEETLRLLMQNSGEHHATRVPFKERGRCKLCTKRKIDSRTCIRCNNCNLYLCQTSKETALQNGTVVSSSDLILS